MCYFVSSVYNKLIEMDKNDHQNDYNFVWLKKVPLKVSIFAWKLMHNRMSTKDNLWKRHILEYNEQGCTTNCNNNEDVHHLFVKCEFFGKIWYFISNWLGFNTTFNGSIVDHITDCGSLRGFSHKVRNSLYVIWFSVI